MSNQWCLPDALPYASCKHLTAHTSVSLQGYGNIINISSVAGKEPMKV